MVRDIVIDVVGSFADGKTTLVKALTSESTLRHSEERKRGITIRLGYAHFLLYKCAKCGAFGRKEKCEVCGGNSELYYRVSIIDSPGHKTLMTIMLSGAPLVDGAVLVIAANNKCPQPQTEEHLEALKIIGVKNLVVAQTKVDVVGPERARESYNEIKAFLAKNGFADVEVVPVFAAQNINLPELLQHVGAFSPVENAHDEAAKMLVVRSFDINKPGEEIKNLKGGVLGGGLNGGAVAAGDEVVVYPGVLVKNTWKQLRTKIKNIQSEFGKEKSAGRGLMVGIETTLDPSLARRDSLAGSLIVKEDNPPLFRNKISLNYTPLEEKEKTQFKRPIQMNETVLLNVLASKILGTVTSVSGDKISINLGDSYLPYYKGDKAIVSRKAENVWVLAGAGTIYD